MVFFPSADANTSEVVLHFLQIHGYWLVFLIMVYEGPLITTIAAFAASLGIFNIFIIFILSVLGNFIGDIIYYYIGKFSRRSVIDKYFKKFNMGSGLIKKVELRLQKSPGKALTIIKIIPPLPTPGLILAGVINMDIKIFLWYSFIISFFYSLVFTLVGFYAGFAFNSIFSNYTHYMTVIIITLFVITILFWLCYYFFQKAISKKFYSKI